MKEKSPWSWIPSLYFSEGLPYVVVMSLSVIMYKKLGLTNSDIAIYTGWFYLPWVIKPFWSPFVDILKSKRWWIIIMQLIIGTGMSGLAFTIPLDFGLQASIAFFWILAFSSATHDIAIDGFYMLGLDKEKQALFTGIRSFFYRMAMVFGQGVLVIVAGWIEKKTGRVPFAWSITFFATAVIFLLFSIYHRFILPKPVSDQSQSGSSVSYIMSEFGKAITSFLEKKGLIAALFYILTYRLAESQLQKMASPFLLDATAEGGLGLSTEAVGIIYGTIGVIALILGGIAGGIALSKGGLKRWIWPMAFALHLPNLAYLYLAYLQPENLIIINFCVALEQFGYGFGFTSYMLFLMLFSDGKYKTSHFAFCTGFMALGMMIPSMLSGWIQEHIGYQHFFIWVMLCTIPGFLSISFLKIKD